MITTTTNYADKSTRSSRKPQLKVEVDWALGDNFQDESGYCVLVEVERSLNEPLGGISLAQGDLRLTNLTDRYTQ